jgi:hypothetical protein
VRRGVVYSTGRLDKHCLEEPPALRNRELV